MQSAESIAHSVWDRMSEAGFAGFAGLRHTPYAMRHALCAMRYAPCAMRHAPCAMRHALCAMRHAPCAMRYALCPLRSAFYDSPVLYDRWFHDKKTPWLKRAELKN